MAIIDYALAGNDTLGTYAPNQLFSGESDIVTGPETILAGQVLDKYTVMGRIAASGKLVAQVPTANDGSQNADCILMHAVNTTAASATTALGVVVPSASGAAADLITETYSGGVFNPDLLVWPAATTTLLARKAAFARTNIRIQRPL